MKVTKRQLRRLIREVMTGQAQADRFTLLLKVEGDKLMLHVKESGMVYDLFDYADATKQKGGLYGLELSLIHI